LKGWSFARLTSAKNHILAHLYWKKGVVYYTYRTWRKHMENQNKIHKPRTLSCHYQHFRDLFFSIRPPFFSINVLQEIVIINLN
jgi:hypothetical protein